MEIRKLAAVAGFALLYLLEIPCLAQDEKLPKDAAIWVIDDTDKVHPITGALLSEGIDVYRGERPSQHQYRRQNNIWDAATGKVKLFAGRNELVSFQIVLEKGTMDLHKVFVNFTDLLGPKARISCDRSIRLFKEIYLQIDGVWYPDALEPFEIAGASPMELPDPRGPLSDRQRVQAVWVDIYVPHGYPSGYLYRTDPGAASKH